MSAVIPNSSTFRRIHVPNGSLSPVPSNAITSSILLLRPDSPSQIVQIMFRMTTTDVFPIPNPYNARLEMLIRRIEDLKPLQFQGLTFTPATFDGTTGLQWTAYFMIHSHAGEGNSAAGMAFDRGAIGRYSNSFAPVEPMNIGAGEEAILYFRDQILTPNPPSTQVLNISEISLIATQNFQYM